MVELWLRIFAIFFCSSVPHRALCRISPSAKCIGRAILCGRRFYSHPPVVPCVSWCISEEKTDGHHPISQPAVHFPIHSSLDRPFSFYPIFFFFLWMTISLYGEHIQYDWMSQNKRDGRITKTCTERTRHDGAPYHHARPLHLALCIYFHLQGDGLRSVTWGVK